MIQSLISLLIALLLVKLAEPAFRAVMHTQIGLSDIFTAQNISLLFVGLLFIGGLAGLVPCIAILKYKPIDVVRQTTISYNRISFSKMLITFQYLIAIILIGCTLTIERQVKYMRTSNLGYESDCILEMDNPVGAGRQNSLKEQLMAIPGVEKVSFVRGFPTQGGRGTSWTTEHQESMQVHHFEGDTAFMGLTQFEVLYRTGIDQADAVWLNETAWKRLGLAPDATEVTVNSELNLKLRGYIRDFHFQDYTQPIGMASVGLMPSYERGYYVLIKISPSNPYGTRDRIALLYNEKVGGEVFQGRFLNEHIAAQYDKQRQMSKMIGTLSIVAIIIPALGMLAMAIYYIRRREKEIAIRKVFGSTSAEVFLRLINSFLKLVLVAFVIAVPIIWYLMQVWLSGYAYRVEISTVTFALAGLLVLIITVGTVWWQSFQAANANPITILKK